MTLAGLEPAIFGSEDQRLIHPLGHMASCCPAAGAAGGRPKCWADGPAKGGIHKESMSCLLLSCEMRFTRIALTGVQEARNETPPCGARARDLRIRNPKPCP